MIALNPNFVGTVDRATKEVIAEEQRLEWEANHPTEKFVPKQRARGKSSSQRRYLRKQGNVIDAKRVSCGLLSPFSAFLVGGVLPFPNAERSHTEAGEREAGAGGEEEARAEWGGGGRDTTHGVR